MKKFLDLFRKRKDELPSHSDELSSSDEEILEDTEQKPDSFPTRTIAALEIGFSGDIDSAISQIAQISSELIGGKENNGGFLEGARSQLEKLYANIQKRERGVVVLELGDGGLSRLVFRYDEGAFSVSVVKSNSSDTVLSNWESIEIV
jgi:hypothetical protein